MIKYSAAFLLLILSLVGFQANSTEILRLFYTWEDTKSFLTHGDQIDVVLPFFYDVNKIGDLEEEVDSKLMSYSKEKGIKVMPVIINLGFSRDSITELLKNKEKQGKVQIALLEACKKNGFWGIQFDFEGIPTSLKQEYSTFVANTAELFHKTGFKLSVTVIPNEVKDAVTPFVKWHMEYWRGGYDISSLSNSADFLTLMAYDQHTRLTPPGPIAGIPWVKKVLQSTLALTKKNNISLGIPFYGRHWISSPPVKDVPLAPWPLLSFKDAFDLSQAQKVKVLWDESEKEPWYWFYLDGIREYVFFSDKKSVLEREKLAAESHLPSVSYFVLGKEDPSLWEVIPKKK